MAFWYVKGLNKIVGYFAYTNSGTVLCEGESCVIAGSAELMQSYLKRLPSNSNSSKDIIKKTSFGEIMDGLGQGASYAFDEEAYKIFFNLARLNGINSLDVYDNSLGMLLATKDHGIVGVFKNLVRKILAIIAKNYSRPNGIGVPIKIVKLF